jgi:hypothetical protein
MIIQRIFKQRTGGAMKRKDQPEWMTDGRSVGPRGSPGMNMVVSQELRARCVQWR